MEQVEADEHSEQPGESRQPTWTSRPSARRHGAKGWALAARAEDSLAASQVSPLSVDLGNLITMCLGVVFFMLFALGYH